MREPIDVAAILDGLLAPLAGEYEVGRGPVGGDRWEVRVGRGGRLMSMVFRVGDADAGRLGAFLSGRVASMRRRADRPP